MAISLPAIRDLLWPGLDKVEGEYNQIPTQFSKVFTRQVSKKNMEKSVEMRYLGLAGNKVDGGNTLMDNQPGERFVWNQVHIGIGLGYAITRNTIDDNLYKGDFNTANLGLQRSFRQTKEIQAAAVFNNGTTLPPGIGGDGQPLFSTAHPIDGGTFANRPAIDVDLNEATLLSASIAIRSNFRDQAGLKFMARAKTLLVPTALAPVAERLTKSELRPGTSDNDVNAIRTVNGGLRDYMQMDFLTSPYAWFLITDVEGGLVWYERIPFEMDMHTDFSTDNLLVKGFERYSFGFRNSRSAYGSFPTS